APATSEVIGHVRVASPEDVHSAVATARRAQVAWGALDVKERARRLGAFRDQLVSARDELAEALTLECGKPRQEALLIELFALLASVGRSLRRAPAALAPVAVPLDLFKHRRSRVLYHPRGVIGI